MGSIVVFLVNVDFVVRNWGRMNVIILPPENKILAERGALEGSVSHVALTVLGIENSTSRKKTQIDLHACFLMYSKKKKQKIIRHSFLIFIKSYKKCLILLLLSIKNSILQNVDIE